MSSFEQQKSSAQAPPEEGKGLLASACFEYMLIELVPMAQRLAEEIYAAELEAAGKKEKDKLKLDDEEMKEAVFYRLESLGYRVGLGLVERCVFPKRPPRVLPLSRHPPIADNDLQV